MRNAIIKTFYIAGLAAAEVSLVLELMGQGYRTLLLGIGLLCIAFAGLLNKL